jgi:hypothetical protein
MIMGLIVLDCKHKSTMVRTLNGQITCRLLRETTPGQDGDRTRWAQNRTGTKKRRRLNRTGWDRIRSGQCEGRWKTTYEAPPSTTRFAPVMYDEKPLARKPATRATSCGWPARSRPMFASWDWRYANGLVPASSLVMGFRAYVLHGLPGKLTSLLCRLSSWNCVDEPRLPI